MAPDPPRSSTARALALAPSRTTSPKSPDSSSAKKQASIMLFPCSPAAASAAESPRGVQALCKSKCERRALMWYEQVHQTVALRYGLLPR